MGYMIGRSVLTHAGVHAALYVGRSAAGRYRRRRSLKCLPRALSRPAALAPRRPLRAPSLGLLPTPL
ncbi:hypothetical protein EVAR_62470_1 [Eumeta japonica]|uniref:Uncharacterized protein n=1 Tax=Eumeta variegata TaxID=151549 RepID=A0A4C1ZL89_EUMVA|nr:hypothetical protein EVAR_62470_1 [Eumeta japonica]